MRWASCLLVLGLGVALTDTTGCASVQGAERGKHSRHAKSGKARAPHIQDGRELDEDDEGETTVLTTGVASFYADALAGRRTASGERYDPGEATCAHRSLPFGTIVIVEHVESGRRARCRVNDRGPFVSGRVIDVSRSVARKLDFVDKGVAKVRLHVAAQPSG